MLTEGEMQHLPYLVPCPTESDASVEQPAPAKVPLLCFRQANTQQTQLKATLRRFKLDGLLITVA